MRTKTLIERLVHNDAVKEDPPEIYGWRVFALAASACFGGMLFGMDMGIIGGVLELDAFEADYNLTERTKANLSSNIVSVLQAGCFFGSLGIYILSDKLGRKPSLLISAAVATLGCIIQAAASGKYGALYTGRIIAGIGVGAASSTTPLYISENVPRAIRGGLTGIYQLFIVTGIMLAFWINYGSSLHISGRASYIVPLVIQALPALLLFGCMLLNKESPRFLAKQDRWEEATQTLCRVRNLPADHPYIQVELADIAAQLQYERELVGGASQKDLWKEMWLIKGNRNRALISIGLMVCQQMTGTNAINYYAPMIFKNLGITGDTTSLFATGIYGVVKVTACLAFLLFVADSLGRRRSLLWTSIAQGLAMFYMGLYVRIAPPDTDKPVPPAGYFALVCVFLFAGFFQFGWGPVPWIYCSEVASARLRSLNVALASATQWLFNFVVAQATPRMLKNVGNKGYGFVCSGDRRIGSEANP
ncbi:general substrate transporter [Eremomyces bilateralis CBS 781.70]|uniref:General substrate transporter n=1 Tax=Eremomyces bilateralis CBS 781.70 TaxID=1392243 RepID=A0A6G1G5E1_9PEZI|nr:general substrate transporter [Eremomyces bilateralis CBS 781.70]KAF1813161.1 general substrate transporter [Eremomyces bilateralis CBS 781.70]